MYFNSTSFYFFFWNPVVAARAKNSVIKINLKKKTHVNQRAMCFDRSVIVRGENISRLTASSVPTCYIVLTTPSDYIKKLKLLRVPRDDQKLFVIIIILTRNI